MKDLRENKAVDRMKVISIFHFENSDLLVDEPIGTVIGLRDTKGIGFTVQLEIRESDYVNEIITSKRQANEFSVENYRSQKWKQQITEKPTIYAMDCFYLALVLAAGDYENQLSKVYGKSYGVVYPNHDLITKEKLYQPVWEKWVEDKKFVAPMSL